MQCKQTDLCGDYLLLSCHGLCRIYTLLLPEHAFLGLFYPDSHSGIEDFTTYFVQISAQKIGG